MRLLAFTFATCALTGMAHGDFLPAETCFHAISNGGKVVARIVPQRQVDGDDDSGLQWVTIHKFRDEFGIYEKTNSFPLTEAIEAHFCFVDSFGKYIVLININHGSAGVILINSDAKATKKWPISELLTETQMKAFAQTTTTDQWFDQGWFSEGTFGIYGPSSTIQRMPSSYSVMEPRDVAVNYTVSIDLARMSVVSEENREDQQDGTDQPATRHEPK